MSVNEVQRKKFMKLPVDHEDTWEGGIMEVPAQIKEDGEEFTPEGAFWVSEKTGAIQPGAIQPPGELTSEDLFNQLVEFAQNEQWGGYRPSKLVVRDETIAAFLRDNLGDEVEVAIQEQLKLLPEILEEVFDRKAPPSYPGYLSVDGVKVEHVRRLAEAASSFYEARPWQFLGDTDVFAIEQPTPPVRGLSHATIMGQAGMEYGISFFSGLDQYQNMMESVPEDEGVFLEHNTVWSLMFNSADHTPVDDMELWNSEGFPLVGDREPRLPVFNCFDTNHEYPQRPEVEELEYVTALLIALSRLSPDDVGTGVFETQLSTGGGFENCRIRFSEPGASSDGDNATVSMEEFDQTGRNEPCPCGSGDKYKYCCMEEVEKGINPTRDAGSGSPESSDPLADRARNYLENVILAPTESPHEVELVEDGLVFTEHSDVSQWLWDRDKPVEEPERIFKELDESPADLGLIHGLADMLCDRQAFEAALEVCRRGGALGREAFPDDAQEQEYLLEWGFHENRPFLRLKHLEMTILWWHVKQYETAFQEALQLLEWNPHDNQGIRYEALHMALHMGVLLEAQCIVDDFEGDYSPYMMYGRALLCHRKGNTDKAVSALEEAKEEFPHVADQLEDPERVEPGEYEQKGGGVVRGGEYEAFLYASTWGYLWWDDPGAMDLLDVVV